MLLTFQEAAADEIKVTPGIKARAAYNDNIFFLRDDALDDFVFTVTPEIDLRKRTERLNTSLRMDFPIYLYTDLDDLKKGMRNSLIGASPPGPMPRSFP